MLLEFLLNSEYGLIVCIYRSHLTFCPGILGLFVHRLPCMMATIDEYAGIRLLLVPTE